jgi:hypothetical protein
MNQKFKALVAHYRPIILRHRQGDSLVAFLAPPRSHQSAFVACKVCGNEVGSDGCKNYRPA